MEEEAEKIREMQKDVDLKMNMSSPTLCKDFVFCFRLLLYYFQVYENLKKKMSTGRSIFFKIKHPKFLLTMNI